MIPCVTLITPYRTQKWNSSVYLMVRWIQMKTLKMHFSKKRKLIMKKKGLLSKKTWLI
ncbi:unnamed protein product [Callosobruchus maculatus]|uniref:Uncharacterized protein n=1 Tax=Callosobruchus maculatus TaxID=64391 RepID=A0A653D8Q6_CALMS|nr:unnamed protein product [Callosobruchus maculatus]